MNFRKVFVKNSSLIDMFFDINIIFLKWWVIFFNNEDYGKNYKNLL